MKKKLVISLLGISMISLVSNVSMLSAEEYYEEYSDEGYYEEYYDENYYDESYSDDNYYDDGYSDNGYSDDGYYDENYYDDGYYDNGDYEDSYSEDYYEEQYYDNSSSGSSDSSSQESSSSSSEEKETEATTEKSTEAAALTKSEDSWHQVVRTNIQRGDNSKRETPNAEGKVHSYLTGKLVDQAIAYQRPVAVMINNIIDALPQDAISKASVIYEAPVEGEITRMMAIFDDLTGIDKIGPVRSCRDYYIDFALEFDAIYVHYGQAVYAYELMNSEMVNNISGLEYQEAAGKINGYAGEDVFFRTDDRPAPHNCYTSEEGIKKGIERKSYSMELDNTYEGHFRFADDGEIVTYTDGTATHIVPHKYSNEPYFDYDAATQKYKRFEYPSRSAGPAQIDQTTGEQLTVDNVIIQYCEIKPYDDHGYLNVNTNSGGEAILFTQGTYQKATWVKATDWGPAKYYDSEGNEIKINQGQTWVCIVQDTKKDTTSFE